jgi:hypothetical protein
MSQAFTPAKGAMMFTPRSKQIAMISAVALALLLLLPAAAQAHGRPGNRAPGGAPHDDPNDNLVPFDAPQEEPDDNLVPIFSPRDDPSPIPHTDVLEPAPSSRASFGGPEDPLAITAGDAAEEQDLEGEPGILQTETGISSGLTLYEDPDTCANFNSRSQWQGELWTMSFAGWGLFARDDGYFQAKNVTFDRELVVGPGDNYNRNSQSSMKIASFQPYEAGIMSPPIPARAGRTVRVVVNYMIYNHGAEAESLDYASMGIIPAPGEQATYVYGYHRGEWSVLEQEIEAQGDEVIVMLQGHSPAALNSNIYFDNVRIYVNDNARGNCRR